MGGNRCSGNGGRTVVVFHDSDFMKLAGKKLKIWDATMDELKDIDIGSLVRAGVQRRACSHAWPKCFRSAKERSGVNIELKYYGHDNQLEQRVADLVESCGMGWRCRRDVAQRPAWIRKMKSFDRTGSPGC